MSELNVQPRDPQEQQEFASWISRVGAYVLDSLVSVAVVLPLYGIGLGMMLGSGASGALDPETGTYVGGSSNPLAPILMAVAVVLGVAVTLWNCVIRQGRTGQTLGKKWIGIAVQRDDDRSVPGTGLALGRYLLLSILSAVTLYLNLLWPLWDAKRQALHDKVVGTTVVKTSTRVVPAVTEAAGPPASRANSEPPESFFRKNRLALTVGIAVAVLILSVTTFWPARMGDLPFGTGGVGGSSTAGETPGVASPPKGPTAVAHRGGYERFPLQTLPALTDAARLRVPVETDVRWTADGVPILAHDDRTAEEMDCGGARLYIDRTPWSTLREKCRTKPTASPDGKRYGIPTLADAVTMLATFPSSEIFAEVKVAQSDQQVRELLEVLTTAGMIDRSVITARELGELRKVRAHASEIGGSVRTLVFLEDAKIPAATLKTDGLWGVAVHIDIASAPYVAELRAAGFEVMIWTVNTAQQWAAAARMGADMVLTDMPRAYGDWAAERAGNAG